MKRTKKAKIAIADERSKPCAARPLAFARDGAQRFDGAAAIVLEQIAAVLACAPTGRAGVRIFGVEALRRFLEPEGVIGAVAVGALGPSCRAVRAILFDKTAATNWSLGWHQDRTIAVAARVDVEGFGPWTIKDGVHHVAPPFDCLSKMVTLRVHLDDVPATHAPLLVAPGSHRLGRVPVDRIENAVRTCGIYACLAQAGDIWLYATPILHASEATVLPTSRRVLQIDYAAYALPGGLEWLGV